MAEALMQPEQAFHKYELTPRTTDDISELEERLRTMGIAPIEMPIQPSDFAALSEAYKVCIQECPNALSRTASRLDYRYGSEIGHVHKKLVVAGGVQISDPKDLFHFSEVMQTEGWRQGLEDIPDSLKNFLEMGIGMHNDLRRQVARRAIGELEQGSYTNLSRLYSPEGRTSSVLRLVRYEGYTPYDKEGNVRKLGEVAKRHYDIGGYTLHAYADAGGFWTNEGGNRAPHENRQYRDTDTGKGYMFFGQAHRSVFTSGDRIQPMWHGVDRIIPEDRPQAFKDGSLVTSSDGTLIVPERTAVIFFGNAPDVDPGITIRQTLPNLK